MLTTRVKTVHSNAHHQDYYMRLIENFIEKKIDHVESSKLNIAAVEKQQGDNLLENLGIKEPNPLIGMSPATAYGVAKAWHPERFKELIGRIKKSCPVAEILIFGSKREDSQIKAICKDLPVKIHNTAGKLTLRETIILISFCRLFITNDSGLMHIASSLGIPQVAIFGPTLPEKTAPLDPLTRIIHHPVDCAPCKYRQCPSDHRCMESVSVDEVMTALIEIWNQKL